MITALALSPAVDVTYLVAELIVGQIAVPSAVVRSAGGKALNAARAAHRLGASVRAIAVLGGHAGALVESLLPSDVALTRVSTPAETRTCVSIASANPVALTELYERAAPVSTETWRVIEVAVREVASGWLAVSGSIPEGCDGLIDLLAERAAAGVAIAVDSHGPALAAMLDGVRPALVKINRAEAAALFSSAVETPIEQLAVAVRARTGGIVVITDGTAGSCAITAEGCFRVSPAGEIGRYPVGSGDSFLGALLAALDERVPMAQALRRAASAASANAMVAGAASFDPAGAARAAAHITVSGPA